jgi:hypothetical protein
MVTGAWVSAPTVGLSVAAVRRVGRLVPSIGASVHRRSLSLLHSQQHTASPYHYYIHNSPLPVPIITTFTTAHRQSLSLLHSQQPTASRYHYYIHNSPPPVPTITTFTTAYRQSLSLLHSQQPTTSPYHYNIHNNPPPVPIITTLTTAHTVKPHSHLHSLSKVYKTVKLSLYDICHDNI